MYLRRRMCFVCVSMLITIQFTRNRAKLCCQRELTTLCADRATVIILLRKYVYLPLQTVACRMRDAIRYYSNMNGASINSGKYSRHTFYTYSPPHTHSCNELVNQIFEILCMIRFVLCYLHLLITHISLVINS